MEIVPKITTVDTDTAVLYGFALMVDSAPRMAAAPQIPLPMEVSNAIPRSIFSSLPR